MTVELFIPCFIDQLFPETAFNTVKVLEKAGCEVVNPLQPMFWGDRWGSLRDPFGIDWAMNAPISKG